MIYKFSKYVSEKLKIEDIDKKTLDSIKNNFKFRLNEYKNYILSNIEYDFTLNKIVYNNFEKIDIPIILRELNNEFSEDLIKDLNIEPFLRKLNQILELKKRNTKKKIRLEFENYFNSIETRIEQIRKEPDTTFGEIDPFEGEESLISRKQYEFEKYHLQSELLKLQEWVIKNGKRVAIVFEGRDAAGKGSTIKRFIEYLNPKGFKVVALGIPTEEEKNNWFDRYEKHLPKPGEIVFFDRSWYNRAVVEPALGYCTEEQYEDFMNNVTKWEEKLIKDGLILIKFWFSITKEKQVKRFELRQSSTLKYWKFSPNDAKVLDKWEIMSNFKNQMFNKTSSKLSPWVIINSNDKKIGRLNAIRYVLSKIDYDNKKEELTKYYPEVVNILN
jgi:polyphosphate kinase 2